MRVLSNCSVQMLTGFLALMYLSPQLMAQEAQIHGLAEQMSDVLLKSNQTKIVVLDFVGTDEMDALGQELGNEFRDALVQESAKLSVERRTQTIEKLQKSDLVIENLRSPATVSWLFGNTGIDAWVSGNMSTGIGGLKVTVQAYRVGAYFPMYTFESSIPLTDKLKALIRERPRDEFAALPRPGEKGLSYPACIYCPQPDYTAEAVLHKLEGTVVLELTIDEEGHARDVRVKVGLPYGLTQQAVDSVTKWKFQPARDSDGKPAAVRQTVEVTFHMF
jgi:TonB family protein